MCGTFVTSGILESCSQNIETHLRHRHQHRCSRTSRSSRCRIRRPDPPFRPWILVVGTFRARHPCKHAPAQIPRTVIARANRRIIGTLRLATKKPWAIDTAYFTPAERPLYLTGMAVLPSHQRTGIGRQLMKQAETIARAWPADAIRLDAFDAAAGAGPFYAKCGYREVAHVVYKNDPLIYFELTLSRRNSSHR